MLFDQLRTSDTNSEAATANRCHQCIETPKCSCMKLEGSKPSHPKMCNDRNSLAITNNPRHSKEQKQTHKASDLCLVFTLLNAKVRQQQQQVCGSGLSLFAISLSDLAPRNSINVFPPGIRLFL